MRRSRAAFILAIASWGAALALPARAADTVAAHTPMGQDQPAQPAASPGASHEPAAAAEPATATGESTGGTHQPLTGQTAAMAAGATYVGSETCTTCHGDVEESLKHTPHGSPEFMKLSPHGCETCHGPGSKHVDNPDDPAFRPRVDKFPASVVNATCRSCHDGRAQFFWDDSIHQKRGLSCATCHSVHHPMSDDAQLRRASISEQCETCHQQVRAETWKNSHHPIREGKITCTDCHNPHGSTAEKLVKADSINDLCYSCHTEKRGPFLWEHQPVRESCMNCHTPHGSNHARLQRVSVPYLCQQCHANTRHPGTLYDARNTPQPEEGLPVPISPSNRLFERGCVNCHAAVHGSNSPSSPYLAH